jgi:hypothetical protein
MKTIDILNLLAAFNRVHEDASLTPEEKRVIGEEVLNQLPRVEFLPTVQASLSATKRSIEDRIKELEAQVAERHVSTGRTEGPKEPSKSLRKTKPNA